jgi:hypothetical protein
LLIAEWQMIRPVCHRRILHTITKSPPRKDKRGVDMISDALPFGRLWYGEPNAISNAIGYAKHRSRSHNAVIRVYDDAGNVIETHEHKGDLKEWWSVTHDACSKEKQKLPRREV